MLFGYSAVDTEWGRDTEISVAWSKLRKRY